MAAPLPDPMRVGVPGWLARGPTLTRQQRRRMMVSSAGTFDGTLGCYVQWGAMVDLIGRRERDLPFPLVEAAVARHSRT